MATTVPKVKQNKITERFVARQATAQQIEVEQMLDSIASGKKPVTVSPEQAAQMVTLLKKGSVYISYDIFPRKEDGSEDTSKPQPKLLYGYVWLGHPEVENAKVLLRNQAIRGDSKNSNAIIESVDKPRPDGTKVTYHNTVGVRFSGWALGEDQAEYERWLKDHGFKVEAQAKAKTDALPVGETKDTAPATFD